MNSVEPYPIELLDADGRRAGTRSPQCSTFDTVRAISGVVIKEMSRRKDFYVLFILTAVITLALGAAQFFGEADITRFLKEICLRLIWIASLVIAITSTARQIPAEREARTLFPLLAKPVTRTQLVLGKFLGCWLAAGLALLVFYSFFIVVSGLREGAWPLLAYGQAMMLHWFLLGIVVAMTLLGSVVFAAPSSTNTITFVVIMGIMLLGEALNKLALRLDEPSQTLLQAVYYVIPHLEFFDVRDLIVHDWGLVPWLPLGAALGYAAIYMGVFLVATCWIFRRGPVH